MSETDNTTQGQKPTRSKLKTWSKVLSIACFSVSAILSLRLWWQLHDLKSLSPDEIWSMAKGLVLSAILGCGFYMLSILKSYQMVKGRAYIIVGIYSLLIILIAIFYYFLVDFINNWI